LIYVKLNISLSVTWLLYIVFDICKTKYMSLCHMIGFSYYQKHFKKKKTYARHVDNKYMYMNTILSFRWLFRLVVLFTKLISLFIVYYINNFRQSKKSWRYHKKKERQHYGQKYKQNLQNNTHKTKDRATRTPRKVLRTSGTYPWSFVTQMFRSVNQVMVATVKLLIWWFQLNQ
jgi:hypothetical protein